MVDKDCLCNGSDHARSVALPWPCVPAPLQASAFVADFRTCTTFAKASVGKQGHVPTALAPWQETVKPHQRASVASPQS